MDNKIFHIEEEIRDQYINDLNPRHWLIAFSGGKDSTTVLQLVWNAVKKLEVPERTRYIHVVCNNTLVENPIILRFAKKQLELIRNAAIEQAMPISVEHTTPSLNSTFWVNLIGRGYVAPNIKFRWCTERLKIKPTTKYIRDKISTYGDVIILLGARRTESSTRARSISKHEVKGKRLSKHILPGAYVFSPIKDLTTQEVWWYLAKNEPPWHSDHMELIHLYRNASDNNDCPLITDLSSPPCGMSRFGCWVCTVVRSDKTMEGLIKRSGEKWMKPLLDFRNMLAGTIDRENPKYDPHKYRMPVRRNYQEGLGPYWPRWRRYILQRLLEAEVKIKEYLPDIKLITSQELVTIQLIWDKDFIYDFNVADIYNEFYGHDIDSELSYRNVEQEYALLRKICDNKKSDLTLMSSLLRAHKNRLITTNKKGMQQEIEHILDEFLHPTFTDVYKKGKS